MYYYYTYNLIKNLYYAYWKDFDKKQHFVQFNTKLGLVKDRDFMHKYCGYIPKKIN